MSINITTPLENVYERRKTGARTTRTHQLQGGPAEINAAYCHAAPPLQEQER